MSTTDIIIQSKRRGIIFSLRLLLILPTAKAFELKPYMVKIILDLALKN
jgi:hypothetical protein